MCPVPTMARIPDEYQSVWMQGKVKLASINKEVGAGLTLLLSARRGLPRERRLLISVYLELVDASIVMTKSDHGF